MGYTLEEQMRRVAVGARVAVMIGMVAAAAFIIGRLTG